MHLIIWEHHMLNKEMLLEPNKNLKLLLNYVLNLEWISLEKKIIWYFIFISFL